MSFSERLKKFDSHSSVAKEFRVYTVQGAVLSVVTVLLILYLAVSEAYFNFQVTTEQRVHVNATSPRGVEMEFDISLHNVRCSELNIDAQDPAGQSQSLHLDVKHHVWKHRVAVDPKNGQIKKVLGKRSRIELGSTLLNVEAAVENIEDALEDVAEMEEMREEAKVKETKDPECGSCYGAGEPGECCNTCEDVQRAYKLKGWGLEDTSSIVQCQGMESQASEEQEGEGCNVHGKVALDSGGGNLHLAPGEGVSSGIQHSQVNLFDLLMQKFHEWNVTHTIHKLRFGPEYPDAQYQLDGVVRTITDTHGMYQYYVHVSMPTMNFVFFVYYRDDRPSANTPLASRFLYLADCSYRIQVFEWYFDSDKSVQRHGTSSPCESWIQQRPPWCLFHLRSQPLARSNLGRIPKRVDSLFHQCMRCSWWGSDSHGDAGSVSL